MGMQSKLDNGQLHTLKKWIVCFISYLCCFSLESFSLTHPCNMPYCHIHVICPQKTRLSATRKEANATTVHVNEAVITQFDPHTFALQCGKSANGYERFKEESI